MSPVVPAVSRRERVQLFSLFGGGRGGRRRDDAEIEDPNPGGLKNDGGSDDGDSGKNDDENFLDKVKSWLFSDAGREDVRTYIQSFAIALLIRIVIVEPRYIPSLSMYPTFELGDQLAVEKVTKRILPEFSRREVVVFHPPQNYGGQSKKSKEALIKRIVAVEGDEVTVRGGKLYVNGERQDEPYTNGDAEYELGPVVVPPGNLLVLGDNRNQSMDSHIWGFLPKGNVIGRACFIYWPPWRIGSNGLY